MESRAQIAFAALAAGLPGPAAYGGPMVEPHYDVLLLPDFGSMRVVTGAFDDDTESVASMNERVFGAEFGEADPMQPNFADEPGFRSLAGNFAGEEWGFNITDAVFVWDEGSQSFNTGAAAAFTITINFGPSPDVTSPGAPGGFTAGFTIPVPAGGFDDHLNIHLDAPEDGTADGIYLLSLNVFTTNFAPSEDIWFVMNRGLDEAQHGAAEEWVRANLVPTPSGAALFALVGAGARRRRN